MIKFLLPLILGFVATIANASCDFTTADFLSEIYNPKSIKKIEIEVSKSGQFNRNFAKILTHKSRNILPSLKKNFKAKVRVQYEFGSCSYNAKVKQHGDWRDHIKLTEGGKPLRSLRVRLQDGNILNAVSFKLLIPETRNNHHEVLGSLLLKELGFIAPETFQVKVSINGTESLMLFQENLRKEMMERNARREGPVFEGDESIHWSYKDFKHGALRYVTLSRMINDNWFVKGVNSQHITLSSYLQLQEAHLDNSQNSKIKHRFVIFPNKQKSTKFEDYFFILMAMNGEHAFHLNNRQYYYNVFSQEFEPVYYDGDLNLHQSRAEFVEKYTVAFSENYQFPLYEKMKRISSGDVLFTKFRSRMLIDEESSYYFYKKAVQTIIKNIELFQEQLNRLEAEGYVEKKLPNVFRDYITRVSKTGLQQKIFFLDRVIEGGFLIEDQDGVDEAITVDEMATLISKNQLKGERAVLIPIQRNEERKSDIHLSTTASILGGSILRTHGINILIDTERKVLTILQRNVRDWVLLRDVDLEGWTLIFNGLKSNASSDENQAQRFNNYGMTGCLNFYQATFNGTNIRVQDGVCEDSVNIVNSQGYINSIQVDHAYADAIDIDFSGVKIEFVEVNEAGNDCVDVSGGTYSLIDARLANCGDKGISVGEKSYLSADNVNLEVASLGVSSKDLSDVVISNALFLNTDVCYEATQKKQEFGGARLAFGSLKCESGFVKDKNSTVVRGAK